MMRNKLRCNQAHPIAHFSSFDSKLEVFVRNDQTACIARVQVLQYTSCWELQVPPSGPSMVLVPSAWTYTSNITFHTSSVNVNGTAVPARNFITIVTTTAAKDNLTLDGTLIS